MIGVTGLFARFRLAGPSAVVPTAGGMFATDEASRAGGRDRSAVVLVKELLGRFAMNAGVPGALGVFLLVVAVLGAYAGRVVNDGRAAALREEQLRLARSASTPVVGPDERVQLSAFLERFPPATALPESLRRLNEHAAARGINVQRTDYSSSAVAGTSLTLVSLAIPVQADADAIYAWLGALLREMPEIALDSVSLKRGSTETARVEADIRLQLYLRGRS
ncbi:hypothetical protein [Azoarcus sp. DN11]|uniref:hypothetical protein n=1 Tax=Azoarcus sp. DN11 TaxID=356837 RepID=UPI000EB16305|nr:hypothetical protein [Azoarcus sp. DN11]AYH42350.1 hypothetical protein CDA09_02945 [Azoarcus sp. DN11]